MGHQTRVAAAALRQQAAHAERLGRLSKDGHRRNVLRSRGDAFDYRPCRGNTNLCSVGEPERFPVSAVACQSGSPAFPESTLFVGHARERAPHTNNRAKSSSVSAVRVHCRKRPSPEERHRMVAVRSPSVRLIVLSRMQTFRRQTGFTFRFPGTLPAFHAPRLPPEFLLPARRPLPRFFGPLHACPCH